MGLLGNGFRYNLTGRITTATSMIDGANPSCLPASYNLTAMRRNQLAGAADFDSRASIPDGCRHPVAWLMPQVAGGLSARNTITGSGSATGTVQSGYNIAATLTGTGGVDSASTFLGLIVSLSATITASGGISTASANALATMVATLTGSGSVSATAAGLADLGATLTGAGSVTANNTALMDITATIRGYGDLTPEGIRDSVWNAALANYPTSGSAGNTLSLAGSGGVDYNALAAAVHEYTIEAGLSFEELMRVMSAVLAGKVSGAGTGTETFKGIDGITDRVVVTVDESGNRSATTLDGA
jgi:hypothetical protein